MLSGAPELPWLTMLPLEVLSRHAPWLRPPQSPFEQKTQIVHCRRARTAVRTTYLHWPLSLQMRSRAGQLERGEGIPCWHALTAPTQNPQPATLQI